MIITVDCGTTNMRLRLYDGDKLLNETKRLAGGRNTAFSGSSDVLRKELGEAIRGIIDASGISDSDVEVIVCSGILASDVGIHYIPHAVAPCGIKETARAAQLHIFDDITSIPILLIPGVKTLPTDGEEDPMCRLDTLESMSGEECEAYGIMSALGIEKNFIMALPGSYNKTMRVNGNGQIASISTGMCGEMIAAFSEHTVLRKTLPSPVIRKLIPEKLTSGFDYAREHGMTPSLIKSRMAVTMGGYDLDEAANLFVGILLVDDIMSSVKQYKKGEPFVVGGGYPLCDIFCILLSHAGVDNIIKVPTDIGKAAPSIGAMRVWAEYKEINR